MKIRLTEASKELTLGAMVEDYPQEGESQEVFEERIVRLAERLMNLGCPMNEEKGDDECRTSTS